MCIIPLALALVAGLVNQAHTRTEQKIAEQRYEQDQESAKQRYERDQESALDKQREDLLQTYVDHMSELLLEKKLRTTQPDAEERNVARVRTINILMQLDARRIGYVFAFRQEAGLQERSQPILSLQSANLRKVHWPRADLHEADLHEASLGEATLCEATLLGATLFLADLRSADLRGANLFQADLRGADLKKAIRAKSKLSPQQQKEALFEDREESR